MTVLLAVVALVTTVVAAVVATTGRRLRVSDRVRPYRAGSAATSGPSGGAVWSSTPRLPWAALGRLRTGSLSARLQEAGRDPTEAEEFRVRQFAHAGIAAAAGAGFGAVVLGSASMTVLLGATGAAVGFSRAPARLAREAEARRLRMRLELVTIDQVLAIHVRAGAGPVQAIMRVVARGNGVIVDELGGILHSIRTGRSEAEAFRHAARLTSEPHAARTYRLFALASEQGADLGVALRALSDDLRDVRRDELRRQATRRRAAMLLPTIAVLAPIMLLFVIAPLPSIALGGR